MDGPGTSGFSGGGEIAASWVTIGADMSGLRAAEQESRAIVDRIGQMSASVGLGGGSVTSPGPTGAAGTAGTFSLPSPSFGTIGGGSFISSGSNTPAFGTTAVEPYEMKGDVYELKPLEMPSAGGGVQGQQVAQEISGQLVGSASQIGQAIAAAIAESLGGLGGGGGSPIASPGSAPPGSSFGRGRNPLSIYGAAYRLGVGLGTVVAAEESVRLGSTIASAYDVASHPEYILNDAVGPMDPLGMSGNAVVRSQAAALADNRGSQRVLSGVESVPLVGSLFQLGDAITGTSTGLAESDKQAARNIDVARTLAQVGRQGEVAAADLTGNPVDRLLVESRQQEDPFRRMANQLPALQARAASEVAQQYADVSSMSLGTGATGNYRISGPSTIDKIDPELAGQIANAQAAAQRLSDMERNNRQRIGIAEAAYSGQLTLHEDYGETSLMRGRATDLLAARSVDSERQALSLRQRAEYQDFASRAAAEYDAEQDPVKRNALRAENVGRAAEIESRQSKERADLERDIANNVAQAASEGGEMILRAHRQFYAADLAALDEYARKRREAVKGKSPEEQQAAENDISARGASLSYAAEYAAGQFITSANSSVASAGLRSRRMFFQAQLNDFDTAQLQAIGQVDTSGPFAGATIAGMWRRYQANRSAMQVAHAQELQMEREDYAGQSTVAQDILDRTPITGRADAAIARARRMVETASPEARNDAILAGRNMLRAEMYQLTAQRGGETAIDMSVGEALGTLTGSGIDLTGRMRDVRKAQQNLQNGINDLPNARLTTDAPSMDQEAKQALNQMVSLLTQLVSKSGVLALFK